MEAMLIALGIDNVGTDGMVVVINDPTHSACVYPEAVLTKQCRMPGLGSHN